MSKEEIQTKLDEIEKNVTFKRSLKRKKRKSLDSHDYLNIIADYNYLLENYSETIDQRTRSIIYLKIGEIYEMIKKYDESLIQYEKIRRIYDTHKEIFSREDLMNLFNNYGDTYFKINNFNKSSRYFRKALEFADSNFDKSRLHYSIAIELIKKGYGKEASENFEDSIKFEIEYSDDDEAHKLRNKYNSYTAWLEELSKYNQIDLGNTYLLKTDKLFQERLSIDRSIDSDKERKHLDQMKDYADEFKNHEFIMEIIHKIYPKEVENNPVNCNEIGFRYMRAGRHSEAMEYFNKGEILYETGKFDDKDLGYLLDSMGENYELLDDFKNSEKYLKKALKVFEDRKIIDQIANTKFNLAKMYIKKNPNKYESKIKSLLEDAIKNIPLSEKQDFLESYSKYYLSEAIDEAMETELGRLWTLQKVNEYLNSEETFSKEFWEKIWKTVNKHWEYVFTRLDKEDKKKLPDELTQDFQWMLDRLLQKVDALIVDETTVNYLVGMNDIKTDYENAYEKLNDEQTDLPAMWFVEFPYSVRHDEKYLKIRLNNLFRNLNNPITYPTTRDKKFPPHKRVTILLEFPWHQRIEIDHIFEPNSKIEYDQIAIGMDTIEMKDNIIINIHEHLKKFDKLVISYSLKFYFDDDDDNADKKTTFKKITIPIVRKNRIQVLEKYKARHANALALFLVGWSFILSILGNINYVFAGFNFIFSPLDVFYRIILSAASVLILIYIISKYLFRKQTYKIYTHDK